MVITSKKFWEQLPSDLRSSLEVAMAEATEYANRIAKQANDLALDEVRKSGKSLVVIPNAEQKMAMKKLLAPVHAQMASRIGRENIEAVYRATADLDGEEAVGKIQSKAIKWALDAWPWLLALIGALVVAAYSTKAATWFQRQRGMM